MTFMASTIGGHAIADGVAAGGIIGDDAAHGCPVAASRVGAKCRSGAKLHVEFIQHHARLHPHPTLLRVDRQHLVRWRVMSMTRASLTAWPARLLPRCAAAGHAVAAASSTAAWTSSTLCGSRRPGA